MNLSYQKRVASKLLKCGLHRVWVDDRPEVQERISEAVTTVSYTHLTLPTTPYV